MKIEVNRLIESIWKGSNVLSDTGILKLVGKQLQDSMEVGFSQSMMEVDWTTPDAEMLQRLTRDVWQFSAAKNYQQLRDMTMAMKDENGKLRTFADFEEKALTINDQYNKNWLKTEYNQAVNSATMAARWNDYKKNAAIMPYLQYQTVGDNNVREEHRLLDGIVRKIDDSFWTTHYPPNGWNCRCDVNQIPYSHAKETTSIPNVPIASMFRTNLADTGLIFPKGHPYYEDIPHDVLRSSLAHLPADAAYNSISINGGITKLHLLHHELSDEGFKQLRQHIEITEDLYRLGYKDAKLLPSIHEKDAELKPRFYPTKYNPINIKKNPDCWIKDAKGNDLVTDYKYMTGTGRNLAKHITEGAEQGNFVVVKMANESIKISGHKANGLIVQKMTDHPHLKGVIILDKQGNVFARNQ